MTDPFDPDGLLTPTPIQKATTPRLYQKTEQAVKLIVNHGLDAKTALKLATGNPNPGRTAVGELRRKAARYSLTRPAMVKMAHDVVKKTLAGEPDSYTTQKLTRSGEVVTVTETVAPTHTNKLTAAAMVFDRAEPVIRQNVNLNGDLKDFMPVVLDDFS